MQTKLPSQVRSAPSSTHSSPSLNSENSAAPAGLATSLLNLQRSHGNGWVQRMLRDSGPQSQERNGFGTESGGVPGIVHGVLCAPGAPLEAATRRLMESRFDEDFSGVRIHTDATAALAARSIGAHAFAVQDKLVFGAGQYRPETAWGQQLLAHELAHTIQQKSSHGSPLPAQLRICRDAASERDANAVAEAVYAGRPTSVMTLAPSAVQRYESGEHPQFGGARGDQMKWDLDLINHRSGVTITYSQMMALADLFEEPEDVREEAMKHPDRLKNLLKLVDRDRLFREKHEGEAVGEDEWDSATGGRYLRLAARNEDHFIGRNIKIWESYHKRALLLSASGSVEAAMQMNAFSAHYLTDAFSAGHQVDKLSIIKSAQSKLHGRAHGFIGKLSKQLLKNSALLQKLEPYEVRSMQAFARHGVAGGLADQIAPMAIIDDPRQSIFHWSPVSQKSLGDVLTVIEAQMPEKFYNIFPKAMHDWLNRDIGRSLNQREHENRRLGIDQLGLAPPSDELASPADSSKPGTGAQLEVTNGKGDHWLLSGDTQLSQSPDSLRIGQQAVEEARRQVEQAASIPETVAPRKYMGPADWDRVEKIILARLPKLLADVEDYLPHPTSQTQAIINQLENTIGNPHNPESIVAYASVLEENLQALIDQLKNYGLIRLKASG